MIKNQWRGEIWKKVLWLLVKVYELYPVLYCSKSLFKQSSFGSSLRRIASGSDLAVKSVPDLIFFKTSSGMILKKLSKPLRTVSPRRLVKLLSITTTVCPRSSDPFYIVGYYITWVTTSWTYSTTLYFWSHMNNHCKTSP